VPRTLFAEILWLIAELPPPDPAPASTARLLCVPKEPRTRCALMKAILEYPTRCAPISTAIGPFWNSERGLTLANAIVRQQSWVRILVIRWTSA
jgi:hypothetical protein